MKPEDQYLKFVRWEEKDRLYVGYCPDLFPWGGVCHATREEEAYRQLCAPVQDEVEELRGQAGNCRRPTHVRCVRLRRRSHSGKLAPGWRMCSRIAT